jgi:hypothetical protein
MLSADSGLRGQGHARATPVSGRPTSAWPTRSGTLCGASARRAASGRAFGYNLLRHALGAGEGQVRRAALLRHWTKSRARVSQTMRERQSQGSATRSPSGMRSGPSHTRRGACARSNRRNSPICSRPMCCLSRRPAARRCLRGNAISFGSRGASVRSYAASGSARA